MLFHTYQLLSSTPFKCHRWQNWQFQLVASLSLSTYTLPILSFPTYLLTYLPIYLPTCRTLLLLLIYLQSFMPISCRKWQNCQFRWLILAFPTFGLLCLLGVLNCRISIIPLFSYLLMGNSTAISYLLLVFYTQEHALRAHFVTKFLRLDFS